MGHVLLLEPQARPMTEWRSHLTSIDGVDGIETAADPESALFALETGRIAVALVDATLGAPRWFPPRSSAAKPYPRPVVLHVVPGGRPSAVEQARAAGADDVLEAPLSPAVLQARVGLCIRLSDAERRARELTDESERRRREQASLLDALVHDLRSPAAVLGANLGWVADELERAFAREVSDAIADCRGETRRLQAMLDDLSTIARLERPSGPPIGAERVGLAELFDEVVRAGPPSWAVRDIPLRYAPGGKLAVRGDRTLLRRLVENLVERARRAGSSVRAVGLGACARDAVEVAIEVTALKVDPTEGLATETESPCRSTERPPSADADLPAVSLRPADTLARTGTSEQRRLPTAGIGMRFCKRVAEAHGGSLVVDDFGPGPIVLRVHLPAA